MRNNSTTELTKLKKELLKLKQEKLRLRQIEKAKTDLIYLVEEILNYPSTGKIHKEIAEFLQNINEGEKAVILLPRKHLKTTIITISWTIQQLINNPELRIFICNERLDNAKSFLREIKSHFEKNKKFRELFGNWVNEKEKWTETQIIIKPRQITRKEPTIQIGSLDTSLVSQHYDLIIADDLVSRNNTTTKEQIEKVKQYWKDLISLAENHAKIIDIGTRWHFDDLHGWLLEKPEYKRMIKSCWDDKKQPIFPEKFSKKNLQEIKNEIGSYDFSCLYENNPIDDEHADFRRNWFKRISQEDFKKLPKHLFNVFITIDPAVSQKDSADFTGIIINYVDEKNNWYIKAKRIKVNTAELIREIFNLYEIEKPTKIGIEKIALTEAIKPFLLEEQKRRNVFLPLAELDHKQTKKEIRIRALVPRYEQGTIYHIESETEELEDELLRFPKSQYDDLSDALAYQLQIAKPPMNYQQRNHIIQNRRNYQSINTFE